MSHLLQERLSANLSFLFGEWTFLDRFAAAADAGFTAVEFMFPYDHSVDMVAKHAADCKLAVDLFNAPAGDWESGERGLAALEGSQMRFKASIELALRYAAALGTRKLHVMAGVAPASSLAVRRTYRHNLELACDQANAEGVRLLVEPINQWDMPGYFLGDVPTALDVVTQVPGLALQFDIYHCHRIHGTALDWLTTVLPVTEHVQLAGVPDRAEPRAPALPLPAIFGELSRAGYDGRVGCEYRPAGTTLAGLAWIEDLEAELA